MDAGCRRSTSSSWSGCLRTSCRRSVAWSNIAARRAATDALMAEAEAAQAKAAAEAAAMAQQRRNSRNDE